MKREARRLADRLDHITTDADRAAGFSKSMNTSEYLLDSQRRRDLSNNCRQWEGRLIFGNKGFLMPNARLLLHACRGLVIFDREPSGEGAVAIWFDAIPAGGEIPVSEPRGEILDSAEWRWKA